MMQRFNKLPERPKKKTSWFGREKQLEQTSESVQPLIYATYQAYLRRWVLTTRLIVLGSNFVLHIAHQNTSHRASQRPEREDTQLG